MTTLRVGSTPFNMTRDINGFNGFGLVPAYDILSTTLTSEGGNQSFTVPGDKPNWIAIFSFDPGLRVFVALNTTATIPTSSFISDVSELNPTAWYVQNGDVLNFITPDTAAYVTVKLYTLL